MIGRIHKIHWFRSGYGIQHIELYNELFEGYKLERGYFKIWLGFRVIDRALTYKAAKRRIAQHKIATEYGKIAAAKDVIIQLYGVK